MAGGYETDTVTRLETNLDDLSPEITGAVMEKLLEDVSYDAARHSGQSIVIDAPYVDARLKSLAQSEDLARYVL